MRVTVNQFPFIKNELCVFNFNCPWKIRQTVKLYICTSLQQRLMSLVQVVVKIRL